MQKTLSILTISRSVNNMIRLLKSLVYATTLSYEHYEVLCSWNGDGDAVNQIKVPNKVSFNIYPIYPYNFARNNNRLALKSSGKYLAFINDDIIFDVQSLDSALDEINDPIVGIVGGNLRYVDNRLQHAGVYFDENGMPFHYLKGEVDFDDSTVQCSRFVPALTGAFLLIRRKEFLALGFNEQFEVAGEDIEFCIRYKEKFQRKLLYSRRVSCVHLENSTRKKIGQKLTPDTDMNRILKATSVQRSERQMKVRIVTEEPGWIMYRKAEEIRNNSSSLNVSINMDLPQADIHYYMPYGKFNHRPAHGIVIANFTHYDPDILGEKFYRVAEEVDHCIAVSESTKEKLIKGGVDARKISVILVGAAQSFTPKLLVGVVGRTYPGGRKGEHLVKALVEDSEVMDLIDLVSNDKSWGVPLLQVDYRESFYRALDYLLVPSLIEGGPVPFMEALACGTLAIAPEIGVVPQFPHVSYRRGDYGSLKQTLLRLAEEHQSQRSFLTDKMKGLDWENWGFQHERLFHRLYFLKNCDQKLVVE